MLSLLMEYSFLCPHTVLCLIWKTFLWSNCSLKDRQTTPLSSGEVFSLHNWFWRIYFLCNKGQWASWGSVKLNACWFLSSSLILVAEWICFSCSIYRTGDPYISTRTQALSFGFLSKIRLNSVQSFPLWEGCWGHTVQNAHQAFLLITVHYCATKNKQ